MYARYTYQIECWKHSHPARLRALDNKGKARLHLKYHYLDMMQWPSRLGKRRCVDPQHLDDSNGEEYSASYGGKVFQTWTMEGIAIYHDSQVTRYHLEKLKNFRFIYLVKLIKGWDRSWSCTSWTMNHHPCTPNMSYLGYCTCSYVKCFSRIWSPRNGLYFWNPWPRKKMKIPLGSYEDLLFVQ